MVEAMPGLTELDRANCVGRPDRGDNCVGDGRAPPPGVQRILRGCQELLRDPKVTGCIGRLGRLGWTHASAAGRAAATRSRTSVPYTERPSSRIDTVNGSSFTIASCQSSRENSTRLTELPTKSCSWLENSTRAVVHQDA